MLWLNKIWHFDVYDSCLVHHLLSDNCQNKCQKTKNMSSLEYCMKTVWYTDWIKFVSFDVTDRYHVMPNHHFFLNGGLVRHWQHSWTKNLSCQSIGGGVRYHWNPIWSSTWPGRSRDSKLITSTIFFENDPTFLLISRLITRFYRVTGNIETAHYKNGIEWKTPTEIQLHKTLDKNAYWVARKKSISSENR